jgi:hypothetical protein
MAKIARECGVYKFSISRWIRESQLPAQEESTGMRDQDKRPQDCSPGAGRHLSAWGHAPAGPSVCSAEVIPPDSACIAVTRKARHDCMDAG